MQRAGVVDAHGKDAVPQDEVARHQPQRLGAGRRLRQVGDLEVQLAGEGVDERLLGDEAVADEHLAQTASLFLLPGEDLVQLGLGHETAGDEQGAHLETAGAALLATGGGHAELLGQLLGLERFGDVVDGPHVLRLLEALEVVLRAEHDHRRLAQLGRARHQPQHVVAVDALQGHVQKQHVGGAGAQGLEGRRLSGVEVELVHLLEVRSERFALVGIVVHDREPLHVVDRHSDLRIAGTMILHIGRYPG